MSGPMAFLWLVAMLMLWAECTFDMKNRPLSTISFLCVLIFAYAFAEACFKAVTR